MPVVGLLDRGIQRLVVQVKEPAAVRSAGCDRPRVSTLDQAPQEVRRLLAVSDAGEAAILALDEYAAVDQYLDQKPRLPWREGKGAHGFGALLGQAIDVPSVRGERQIHQRNSSATRGLNGAVPLVRPPP